jgi:tRNA pseudouridine55 synthase
MQVLYFRGKVNGYLLIDKQADWTSQDVVAYLKGKWKWDKAGHTGTLDPGATGLLIVLLGETTKQFGLFQKLKKEYMAKIEFGRTTDTDDLSGVTTSEYEGKIDLDNNNLKTAIHDSVGERWQIPPQISAVKIHGKPACRLVRKGKTVELKPKKVNIYAADLIEADSNSVTVRYVVSSGTYIRSLARDLGEKFGYGAFLSELRRTKIGDWSVDSAKKVEEITPEDLLIL